MKEMTYLDQREPWRSQRRAPAITFTGTPMIPYMIVESRADWELEYARIRRDAESGAPRFRTHRLATMRHAVGGVMIRAGERLAGSAPPDPVSQPVGDLHATC